MQGKSCKHLFLKSLQFKKVFNTFVSVMDHSQERLISPLVTPGSPQVSAPVPSRKVSRDADLSHTLLQVSTLSGNVVHLSPLPGTLVQDCTRQCMYDDTLSCGKPLHQCIPLTINLSIAKMKASGGILRLGTWDGELLQDIESIPNCKFFKFIFMNQIGQSPQGMSSSLGDICA